MGVRVCFVHRLACISDACPETQLIYPMILHWRKVLFLFLVEYQLEMASWLGVGFCPLLPINIT